MQRAEDWHFHIGNLLTADCRKGSAGSFLLNMDPRSTKDNFLFYLNSSRGFRLNNVKLKEEDNPHYMVLKIMICAVEHTHSMMSGTERKVLLVWKFRRWSIGSRYFSAHMDAIEI
ncbi:hypothetical protein KY290_002706 [Solanum tuberosum]|uniref:Uncharacterized protein n=1 Tax=Solanum tuberosum TaxID=4113 RepID=A0ABQ7WQU3_SOLTU|nr:hypothetical protein KY290_002706 [Solanum tuberosum]